LTLLRFVTMFDSLYQYYDGHCTLAYIWCTRWVWSPLYSSRQVKDIYCVLLSDYRQTVRIDPETFRILG
jgi:hypothetical protein